MIPSGSPAPVAVAQLESLGSIRAQMKMMIIFFAGFGVFMLAAVFVHIAYVQPYIEAHGERAARGPVIVPIAFWRDYQAARRIAKQRASRPRFLSCFEWLTIIGSAFFVAFVMRGAIWGV